jgi:ParB-like chromosome segregation protein Spo0J
MISSPQEPFVEIALSEIRQSCGRLHLVHPQADAGMMDSLRQFGRIFPVVVVPLAERYELVDGFKRLRALKHLGYERVKANVVNLGVHALKAAMIALNRRKGAISDLEEGMVVQLPSPWSGRRPLLSADRVCPTRWANKKAEPR